MKREFFLLLLEALKINEKEMEKEGNYSISSLLLYSFLFPSKLEVNGKNT